MFQLHKTVCGESNQDDEYEQRVGMVDLFQSTLEAFFKNRMSFESYSQLKEVHGLLAKIGQRYGLKTELEVEGELMFNSVQGVVSQELRQLEGRLAGLQDKMRLLAFHRGNERGLLENQALLESIKGHLSTIIDEFPVTANQIQFAV